MPTADDVTQAVIQAVTGCLDACVETIRHCLDQLTDEQLWWRPNESMNSIGNLLLHLNGNLRQWIVCGIGGATDNRDRPAEFSEQGPMSKATLLSHVEAVVAEAKDALGRADAEGLLLERRIQGMDVTGWQAIMDSVPHFKGHTQEIICLTRMQLGDGYRFHWQPSTAEQGAVVDSGDDHG